MASRGQLHVKPWILCLLITFSGCSSVLPTERSPAPRQLFELKHYPNVQDRRGQNGDLVVVVAISGGGYRAANFGIGALLAMEGIGVTIDGKTTQLIDEIDYFTTVSGGGFAAAAHVSWMLSSSPAESFYQFLGRNVGSFRMNHLLRMIGASLHPRSLLTEINRGDALQERLGNSILSPASVPGSCMDQSFRSDPELTLGDLFRPGTDGNLCAPIWITNATVVRNGSIFSFTPDVMEREGIAGYRHHYQWQEISDPTDLYKVPLALGMRSSMNFPVAIPATTLRVRKQDQEPRTLHLSDGGQADNLAIFTAMEILKQELERDLGAVPPRKPRPRLLIVIDAFNGNLNLVGSDERAPIGIESALRSPFLPLDAHRFRVQEGLRNPRAGDLSVIDGAVGQGDLAVAYLDIDREPEARSVGTTLYMSENDQISLIEAGRHRALSVLQGDACDAATEIPAGHEQAFDIDCGVLRFDEYSKQQLRKLLVSDFRSRRRDALDKAEHLRRSLPEKLSSALITAEVLRINNLAEETRDKVHRARKNVKLLEASDYRGYQQLTLHYISDLDGVSELMKDEDMKAKEEIGRLASQIRSELRALSDLTATFSRTSGLATADFSTLVGPWDSIKKKNVEALRLVSNESPLDWVDAGLGATDRFRLSRMFLSDSEIKAIDEERSKLERRFFERDKEAVREYRRVLEQVASELAGQLDPSRIKSLVGAAEKSSITIRIRTLHENLVELRRSDDVESSTTASLFDFHRKAECKTLRNQIALVESLRSDLDTLTSQSSSDAAVNMLSEKDKNSYLRDLSNDLEAFSREIDGLDSAANSLYDEWPDISRRSLVVAGSLFGNQTTGTGGCTRLGALDRR